MFGTQVHIVPWHDPMLVSGFLQSPNQRSLVMPADPGADSLVSRGMEYRITIPSEKVCIAFEIPAGYTGIDQRNLAVKFPLDGQQLVERVRIGGAGQVMVLRGEDRAVID